MTRLRILRVFFAIVSISVLSRFACGETDSADLIRTYFRPFQTDRASLSPDGKYVAYSEHRDDKLYLIVLNVDTHEAHELPLAPDAVQPLAGVNEKTPMTLSFLRWATPTRLVACLQSRVLFAVDADGRNFKELLTPRSLIALGTPALQRAAQTRPPAFSAARTASMDPSIGYSGGAIDHAMGDPQRQMAQQLPYIVTTNPGAQKHLGSRLKERNALLSGGLKGNAADEDAASSVITPDDESDPVPINTQDQASPLDGIESLNSTSSSADSGSARFIPVVREMLTDDPETIIVEARGPVGPTDDSRVANATDLVTFLYKVNIRTGSASELIDQNRASRVLCDKQGHPRLAINHFNDERDYLVATTPQSRFKSLDALVKTGTPLNFRLTPDDYFGHRSVPLEFDYDPNVLYYASNIGRDTFGIYQLDLKTGQPGPLAIEYPQIDLVDLNAPLPDDVLVFDRFAKKMVGIRANAVLRETIWLDRDLIAFQEQLKKAYPLQTFEVIEWDRARNHFLLSASTNSNPGGYYLYDRAQGTLVEFAKRAPWITDDISQVSVPIGFDTATGIHLTGYFTLPVKPHRMPAPLLIYCHDGPWLRDLPGYNPGVQALASMGFAVLQLNYRGSSGFGNQHLQALRQSYDRPALEDILASIDWLQTRFKIDRHLVAILGSGYGGYLALRGLQLYPDRFRCAVSINAPTQLNIWIDQPGDNPAFLRDVRRVFLGTDGKKLSELSPTSHPDLIKSSVLIVQAEQDSVVPVSHALALRDALAKNPEPAHFFELTTEGHSHWLPSSYAKTFETLQDFFNLTIYNFTVHTGPAVEKQ